MTVYVCRDFHMDFIYDVTKIPLSNDEICCVIFTSQRTHIIAYQHLRINRAIHCGWYEKHKQ